MLKNLKSLFIVSEEVNENKAPKTESKEENKELVKSSAPKPASEVGKINEKILEKLLVVIEKNNIDGFDYLEYKRSLEAMKKLPIDDKTKFQSAFATASTVGATVEKLLSSVEFYKKVLSKEKTTFLAAVDGQIDSKVSSKKQQMLTLDKMMKEKSEQIKKLTEDIGKHQKSKEDLSKQITEDNSKITLTRNEFNATYANLISQIDSDAIKIKEYLK